MTPVNITLAKLKYRARKPRGHHAANYDGNVGVHRFKHAPHPAIHGINRKRHVRTYNRR